MIYIVLALELLTAILATISYNKYKATPARFLLYLFWLTALVEISMYVLFETSLLRNNNLYYNIYDLTVLTGLPLIFASHVVNKTRTRIIIGFVITFLVSVIVNCFYESFLYGKLNTAFMLGGMFLIISIVIYFVDLLMASNVEKLSGNLLVYVGVGYLLFEVCFIPFDLIRVLLSNNLSSVWKGIAQFQMWINILMYSIFCIGFIKAKNNMHIQSDN